MALKIFIVIGMITILSILIIKLANKSENTSLPSKNQSSEQDIIAALSNGNKIEAIKHYRYVHGVGLKEAKEAVEELMNSVEKPEDLISTSEQLSNEQGIIDALKNGSKLAAIKLYRDVHGVGLKEAKDAIEELSQNL